MNIQKLFKKAKSAINYKIISLNYLEKYIKFTYLFNSKEIKLPLKYGVGLGERVIEIPWALSQIPKEKGIHLDAGSSLNFKKILNHKKIKNKNIIIQNLNVEKQNYPSQNISYIYGDLRQQIFKDQYFDSITCISVLEHIGMDNTKYTGKKMYKENNSKDYQEVIKNFKNIIKKKGICLITVPYGKNKSYGWLQIFDKKMLNELVKTFSPTSSEIQFFKYTEKGWIRSTEEQCKDCGYPTEWPRKDKCVGSEAIACIKLVR